MMRLLESAEAAALTAKIANRSRLSVDLNAIGNARSAYTTYGLISGNYEDFSVGHFDGIESLYLRWASPDFFEFIPAKHNGFQFTRNNGQIIKPNRFFTDGGSIPRVFWFEQSLSPWGCAPAYLLHDWMFDLHHCGQTNETFESVRDMMMEAVKTLMEINIFPKSTLTFRALYWGINSKIARDLWGLNPAQCALPPSLS